VLAVDLGHALVYFAVAVLRLGVSLNRVSHVTIDTSTPA
jgi:hypothetical protein